jgi:EmrB/QacA subfamily drug resistance transporter
MPYQRPQAVPPSGNGHPRPALAMLGVNCMVFMATLDMSIVNVALPTLIKDLATDFATIQWVVLSYILAVASLLLIISRLGDMRDKRRIFTIGLSLFLLASLCCGLAPGVYWLIGFRALQGIGAAMAQSLGMAIITEIAPPSSRGRALGFIGATVALGLMLGPPLGGVVIGLWHWRAIFLLNVPLGIGALYVVRHFMPPLPPQKKRERFDLIGAGLACLSLGGYALGMTLTQRTGFDDAAALCLLGLSLVGAVAFVLVERRSTAPMLDLTLFTNPGISLRLVMSVLVFITGASGFIMPFFLQTAQGRTVTEMGLLMMILPIAMAVTAPLAGSLADRFGSQAITSIGLAIMFGGTLALGSLRLDTPWWGYLLRSLPVGLGIGVFQAPNNSAIMGEMPRGRLGVGSGLANYARVFGQSTGLSLVGTIFASLVRRADPTLAAIDLTKAPVGILAAGVAGVYRCLSGVLLLALLLSLVAWRLDRRRITAS